jgi:hypothetical protein
VFSVDSAGLSGDRELLNFDLDIDFEARFSISPFSWEVSLK